MKLKPLFSKWSRKIHRWIGLYFALVVLIYTIEAFTLPSVFSAGLPIVDGFPPVSVVKNQDRLLSIEQATQVFARQHPQGVSLNEIDEIAYLPKAGVYRFGNTERFFEWYIDASSGELLKYGFKADLFLEEHNLLGWWQPWIHKFIEFPMLLLLVTLAISGVYLFAVPFMSKKNEETDFTSKDAIDFTEVKS
jgi:hypothetical protein